MVFYFHWGGICGGLGKLIVIFGAFKFVGKGPVGATKLGWLSSFDVEGWLGTFPGLLIAVVFPGLFV